jgi:hypothetical protein
MSMHRRSTAILHLTGKKAWKINGENKSVPHCDSGLTLRRMTSAVVSIRKHEPRVHAVAFIGRRGDRALAASHLPLADARAMDGRVEPGHDGEREGDPLPPVFCKRMGILRPLHHIWWSSPLARREEGGGMTTFVKTTPRRFCRQIRGLTEAAPNTGRAPPHPNPLPQRGQGQQRGYPHPILGGSNGNFQPGGRGVNVDSGKTNRCGLLGGAYEM